GIGRSRPFQSALPAFARSDCHSFSAIPAATLFQSALPAFARSDQRSLAPWPPFFGFNPRPSLSQGATGRRCGLHKLPRWPFPFPRFRKVRLSDVVGFALAEEVSLRAPCFCKAPPLPSWLSSRFDSFNPRSLLLQGATVLIHSTESKQTVSIRTPCFHKER